MDSERSARIRNIENRLDALIRRMDTILRQMPFERRVPAPRRPRPEFPAVKIEYEERDHLTCCVCLDDFQVIVHAKELPCTHKFHPKCIDEWLKMHDTCPICRCSIFTRPVDRSAATHTENHRLVQQIPLEDTASVSTMASPSVLTEATSTRRPTRILADVVAPPHRETPRLIMTRLRSAAIARQSAEQQANHVRVTRQTSRRMQQDERRSNY